MGLGLFLPRLRMRGMLISVVVPTYNRARFVGRAVESVLGQTHFDLELIVVDDGSSDNTGALLESFSDPRLKVLRQENRGVSAARNRGLALAQGAFLALLDSDDYFLPRKLSQQYAFMRETGYAVCQTDEIWIRRGREVNPMRKHEKPPVLRLEKALEMCLASPSCVMFTRGFLEDVGGFDESLPACEDYDFWLRTCLGHELALLPEKLTVRLGGHADQLSRTIVGLDLYRIYALVKLLEDRRLPAHDRAGVLAEMEKKARVYVSGCLKRGKEVEAGRVQALVSPLLPMRPRFG